MSQFRIKRIDQGLSDEWVFRLNDSGIQLGDDIDARDPNELAEAILDTQEELLKTSQLSPNQILKTNSGIAERVTILEQTAGQAGLQDIYENGGMISLLNGQPLVFGSREEIKLDDAGNLSFSPVTMRVKGSGASYVELSNSKVTSTLGNLTLGSISPGFNLTTRSAGDFFLQDAYLNNPITLSQSGQTVLNTVSQSIVGAINELKSSSFTVSMQSVYSQSTPPRIITNLTSGPLIIEDPSSASVADALRIVGNQTITKKLKVSDLQVGNNLTAKDGIGLSTADRIHSQVELSAPLLNSGVYDLTFQDKRLSVPLTENGVSSLETNSSSIVGALNELKENIQNVGGAQTLFGEEHDSSTGIHGIITTKAGLGQNAVKRIIVKDQSDSETFSVSGDGNITANNLLVNGLNTSSLLSQLMTHLSDDGTSHTALANHLSSNNPHNTVKTILGLNGAIGVTSSDGSISVGTQGSNINLRTVDTSTLQTAYNLMATKELSLNTAQGLKFIDSISSQTLMMLRNSGILFNRNINMEFVNPEINATTNLKILPQTELLLSSVNGDVVIKPQNSSSNTYIQDIAFSESGVSEIDPILGLSVLGAFKNIFNHYYSLINYDLNFVAEKGDAFYLDENGSSWTPISDIHPSNQFLSSVNFYHSNLTQPLIAAEQVSSGAEGTFQHSGTIVMNLNNGPVAWEVGEDLFIGKKGYSKFKIESHASISNGDTFTIGSGTLDKVITATTGVPDALLGQFKIESSSASLNINTDKTRDNIVSLMNNPDWINLPTKEYSVKATIDGESSQAALSVDTQISAGDVVQIQPHSDSEGSSVTLTATTGSPSWLQFKVGLTKEHTAKNLAEAINRTTFKASEDGVVNGHRVFAEASGVSVLLTWFKPGLTGLSTSIVVSTPNISTVPFQGGTSELRMYRQDTGVDVIPVDSSNPSGISTTDISANESESQFVMGKTINSSARNYRNEKRIKVGKILSLSGSSIAKIRIG